MKVLVKTKLLDGKYVEARDYELFKHPLKIIHCLSTDYKHCLHIDEPFMTLSLAQQKKGKVINTQRSKFYPYAYYKIYTFLWKPDEVKVVKEVAVHIDESVKSRLAEDFFTKHPELRRKHD